MTTSLHERLEAEVAAGEADGERVVVVSLADLREAAAALRPPEGEIGALCERWERKLGAKPSHVSRAVGGIYETDLRAALAHLRRMERVEAALRDLAEAVEAWQRTYHRIDLDGNEAFDRALEHMTALAERALAPTRPPSQEPPDAT